MNPQSNQNRGVVSATIHIKTNPGVVPPSSFRVLPSPAAPSNGLNQATNRNCSNSDKERIVDKLQGALHQIRRERDDLHRRKELAEERRRLLSQEKEALAKSVQAMQEKFDKIQSTSTSTQNDLVSLEQSVQQLTKEVRAHHVTKDSIWCPAFMTSSWKLR